MPKVPKTKVNIRAVRDFLWVIPIQERQVGAIIIPETAKDKDNPLDGIVVAVGDGLVEGGQIVPLVVKPGDHVYFPANAGTIVKIRETNEEFFLVRENQIFGAISVE